MNHKEVAGGRSPLGFFSQLSLLLARPGPLSSCSFLTCKMRSWLYELPLPLSWSEAVLRIRRHLAQQSLRKQHPDGKGHLRGTRKESGTNKDPSLLVKSLIPTGVLKEKCQGA